MILYSGYADNTQEVAEMDKAERLRATHTYNEHADRVTDELFMSSEFFDPRDLLQVRYEIVRAVALGESPESVAVRFGVSGITVRRYVIRMREGGLMALLPSPRGPSGPRALGAEGENFVDAYIADHPRASGREVHEALEKALELGVSQRTVERRIAFTKASGGWKAARRPPSRTNKQG